MTLHPDRSYRLNGTLTSLLERHHATVRDLCRPPTPSTPGLTFEEQGAVEKALGSGDAILDGELVVKLARQVFLVLDEIVEASDLVAETSTSRHGPAATLDFKELTRRLAQLNLVLFDLAKPDSQTPDDEQFSENTLSDWRKKSHQANGAVVVKRIRIEALARVLTRRGCRTEVSDLLFGEPPNPQPSPPPRPAIVVLPNDPLSQPLLELIQSVQSATTLLDKTGPRDEADADEFWMVRYVSKALKRTLVEQNVQKLTGEALFDPACHEYNHCEEYYEWGEDPEFDYTPKPGEPVTIVRPGLLVGNILLAKAVVTR